MSGVAHEIRRNAVVGNPGLGISAQTNTVTISENNIFGNHSIANVLGTNCGLVSQTGLSVSAPNNFWGAASGPGPDPADAVCDVSGTTTVDPVATKPFNIPVRAGR